MCPLKLPDGVLEDESRGRCLANAVVVARWLLALGVLCTFSLTSLKDPLEDIPNLHTLTARVFLIAVACQSLATCLTCKMVHFFTGHTLVLRIMHGMGSPILTCLALIVTRIVAEVPESVAISQCLNGQHNGDYNSTATWNCLEELGEERKDLPTSLDIVEGRVGHARFIMLVLFVLPSAMLALLSRWGMALRVYSATAFYLLLDGFEIFEVLDLAYVHEAISDVVLWNHSALLLILCFYNGLFCFLHIIPAMLCGNDDEKNYKYSSQFARHAFVLGLCLNFAPLLTLRLAIWEPATAVGGIRYYIFVICFAKDAMYGVLVLGYIAQHCKPALVSLVKHIFLWCEPQENNKDYQKIYPKGDPV